MCHAEDNGEVVKSSGEVDEGKASCVVYRTTKVRLVVSSGEDDEGKVSCVVSRTTKVRVRRLRQRKLVEGGVRYFEEEGQRRV